MEKMLLLILCTMIVLCRLQAQNAETHVTVYAGGSPLETLLTEAQKQSVKNLTIIGTLQDMDYIFLRENLYPQLDTLDLREVNVDTLPNIRVEDYSPKPNYNKVHLVLPMNIEYIGANFLYQFSRCYSLEVTGNFPEFGESVYSIPQSGEVKVSLSDDNFSYITKTFNFFDEWISETYSSIYSLNEDTLYYMNMPVDGNYVIKEGTKVIHGTAFRNLGLPTFTLIFPATLDSIGDYAFEHTECPVPTSYITGVGALIVCYAVEPPKLGKDVFKNSVLGSSILYVHEASIEKYKNAKDWNQAVEIRAIEEIGVPPSRIFTQVQGKKISIKAMPNSYELKFGQEPLYMEMYSTNGVLLTKRPVGSSTLSIDRNQLVSPFIIMLVRFADGTTETVKLIP